MPMTEFVMMTPAKSMSGLMPSAARIATSSTPMIPLTGVSTLARTIWPVVRVGARGTRFTRPSATRSATSAAVSPGSVSAAAQSPITATAGCSGSRRSSIQSSMRSHQSKSQSMRSSGSVGTSWWRTVQ